MQSTLSRPIPLSRSRGSRVADDVRAGVAAVHEAWQRWQASRRRAAEFNTLRQLSPTVLRDIGADPQSINEAQHWREQHDAARDAFLRGL